MQFTVTMWGRWLIEYCSCRERCTRRHAASEKNDGFAQKSKNGLNRGANANVFALDKSR